MSMIKLSNGVEISEETIVAALEKAGIETKPKCVFKPGDVVSYGRQKRIIVELEDKVCSFSLRGNICLEGQKEFEYFGYKYVGRLKDLLK